MLEQKREKMFLSNGRLLLNTCTPRASLWWLQLQQCSCQSDLPDITYTVNWNMRYLFFQKVAHKLAPKQNNHCTKAIGNKWMIMKPTKNSLKIHSFQLIVLGCTGINQLMIQYESKEQLGLLLWLLITPHVAN